MGRERVAPPPMVGATAPRLSTIARSAHGLGEHLPLAAGQLVAVIGSPKDRGLRGRLAAEPVSDELEVRDCPCLIEVALYSSSNTGTLPWISARAAHR